jgi:hypothetical protein
MKLKGYLNLTDLPVRNFTSLGSSTGTGSEIRPRVAAPTTDTKTIFKRVKRATKKYCTHQVTSTGSKK